MSLSSGVMNKFDYYWSFVDKDLFFNFGVYELGLYESLFIYIVVVVCSILQCDVCSILQCDVYANCLSQILVTLSTFV
jgi:hypothetical protein